MTDGRIKFKVESRGKFFSFHQYDNVGAPPPRRRPEGLRQRYLAVRHTDPP